MSTTPSPDSLGGDSLKSPAPPRVPDHELIRRIGRGAYGEVWLARCTLGTYRAVKIVHRASFDHDRPFEREFEGIRQFEPVSRTHDSQVDILHVGRGDGCFYYVMELADDQASGGQILAHQYTPRTLKNDLVFRGRLPFEECVSIGVALTTALQHLHESGLVHRDIKPSNIIFVNGLAKLADIGLVTGIDATRSHVGTEGFAAPEGPGTPQADLFSLGKVLYEMATGRDRQEFPELPTDILEMADRDGLIELNGVIARACRHDPRDRYASAAEMRADLELLQSGKSLARLRRTQRHLQFVQRAGAMVTALAIVVAAGWLWQTRQTRLVGKFAKENASLARQASEAAQQSRDRLVQIQTANGLKAMEADDLATAALWFSEALQFSAVNPDSQRRQRDRLAFLFQQLPKPTASLQMETGGGSVFVNVTADTTKLVGRAFSGGTRLGTAGVKLWQASSLEPIQSITISNVTGRVAVSPNGRWAVTSEEGHIVVREVSTSSRLEVDFGLAAPGGWFTCSGDETKLATISTDKTNVCIFEVQSGRRLTPPLAHGDPVINATFDPTGRWLLTGTQAVNPNGVTGTARFWDVATGKALSEPLGVDGPATELIFNHDGTQALIFGDARFGTLGAFVNSEAKVVRVPGGQLCFPPLRHRNSIVAGRFSPDGRFLATGTAARMITIWNASTGAALHTGLRPASSDFHLRFSPDGSRLAEMGEDGVRIWDVRLGVPLWTGLKHNDRISTYFFASGGRELFTATRQGRITIWDLASPGLSRSSIGGFDGSIVSAVFSPDGQKLVTDKGTGDLRIWETSTGMPLGKPLYPVRHAGVTRSYLSNKASWSPDGSRLIVPSGDRTARIWNVDSCQESTPPLQHPGYVISAAFSPDGQRALTVCLSNSEESCARIWNARTGEQQLPELQHPGVTAAAFSPVGQRVLTVGNDRTIRMWDASTCQLIGEPVQHGVPLADAAFTEDGRKFAVIGGGSQVYVYDAVTLKPIGVPIRHPNELLGFRLSPDGRLLVTYGMDRTARTWDATTGSPVSPPVRHQGYVVGGGFSPSGLWFITASHDGTARIWDTATGEPLAPPLRHSQAVLWADFSPNGRSVATSCMDGTTQIWEMPVLDWKSEDIVTGARLLAGARIADSGEIVPLSSAEFSATWAAVEHRFAIRKSVCEETAVPWHRRQATLNESLGQSFAAQYHALCLAALQPGEEAAQTNLARLKLRTSPRDPAAPATTIDLSGVYNASLSTSWHFGWDNDLAEVPRGVQEFAGTVFDVRGLVQVVAEPLKGTVATYPQEVRGIPLNRKLQRLHFLHAAINPGGKAPEGVAVGSYTIKFADGRREVLPIIYGRDVRDWHGRDTEPTEAINAVIAWSGHNSYARREQRPGIRLFKSTWENPRPDSEVATVDLAAEHPVTAPFLVGLTAE